MHYAAMASNSSIIDPLFSKMTPDQKIDAITAKNKWGYSPLELSKLSIIQDEAGYWIRSDITNTFIDAMVPTPYLEYGTIALPSILGY
ncbi:hypothetical protein FJ364_04685 [Candidatus Dependentiae bacterium]|nr:hypothetical protein [Candidatus Dependentiae bacterium]